MLAYNVQNTCALIVTFHPGATIGTKIQAILPLARAILIVDNASSLDEVEALRALAEQEPRVHLYLNAQNLGIATALNQAADWAAQQGYTWLLCFDQDSQIGASFGDALESAMTAFAESGGDLSSIAVVGSNFSERNTGKSHFHKTKLGSSSWGDCDSVITSGSILSTAAFQVLGRFKDQYFIDYVDTEYCYRARAKGYRVLISTQPTMRHSAGNPISRRFLWRTVQLSQYPPRRWYTIGRNATDLFKHYALKFPSACVHEWTSILKAAMKTMLMEDQRLQKMTAFATGVMHGLIGVFPAGAVKKFTYRASKGSL
jgi:rhamnosyltransferase